MLAAMAMLAPLSGCKDTQPDQAPRVPVRAQKIAMVEFSPSFTLTGEVNARVQSDLSFRISGRLIERAVDVGAEVAPQQLLARLEPTEQRADLDAAAASVQAAEAKLRQVTSSYERQKSLLADGFTTRRDHDNALKDFETAKASLDNARAQLGTATDQLAHAELRSPAAGIITSRNAEVGQVVQSAQNVFTLAQNGPRDVVINVQESLVGGMMRSSVDVMLASDPRIVAKGAVREVSPVVDTQTGTVRVKIGIEAVPAGMTLGSSVVVTFRVAPQPLIAVPAGALTRQLGKPALWVIDPQTNAVALRAVSIETFENTDVVVREGLKIGELVVTGGAQMLRPGQLVAPITAEGPAS